MEFVTGGERIKLRIFLLILIMRQEGKEGILCIHPNRNFKGAKVVHLTYLKKTILSSPSTQI